MIAAAAVWTFVAASAACHAASPTPVSVQIDPAVVYQQMEGFGASLTDSSAWLLNNELTATQRNTAMNALFNPVSGIGMSFLRQPMGASDFATANYTYDDIPVNQTDYGLANFSIAREQSTIVPLLQQAKTLNPNLRLMGTPWSPPAWMKTTGQINGGHLKNSDAVYNTYADYFLKYVQGYQAQGLIIDYVSVQNEPWFETTYPSMGMDPPEAARLIKLVGPKFQQSSIATKILAWDHNWDNARFYVPPLLADAQAAQYIDGIAFHGYGGDVSAQTEIHNQFPQKGIFFTELSAALGSSFAGDLMWDMQNLIVGGTRNWAKTIVRWNLALDQTGGPHLPGGAENCRGMITVDSNTGAIAFNEEYYSLGHISKFVQPGANRVFSDAQASAAFVNPDGSTALIAYNDGNAARTFNLHWQGRTLSYILPAFAVATFSWTDPTSVGVWLTTGDKSKLLARQTSTAFSSPVASTWNVNAMGNWATAANWSDAVPNGVDHEARFAGAISSPHTVYADTPVTVGTIRFNSAHTYVLAGTSTLTLQVSGGSIGSASIDVQAGAHKINLPVTFASNATISVAAGAALKISDPVTINPGVAVTHASSGTIAYESYVNILPGGSLNLAAGNDKTLRLAQLGLGGGGTIDLKDNDLIVAGGDFAQVRSLVGDGTITSVAGVDGGATTTLALFDNAVFGEARWPQDAIVGKYTYLGDTNLDGQVTEADFAAIKMNLDTTPLPGLAWVRGDVNADGRVTSRDLNIVAANLGLGVGDPLDAATPALPEPAAGVVVAMAMAAALDRRSIRGSRLLRTNHGLSS